MKAQKGYCTLLQDLQMEVKWFAIYVNPNSMSILLYYFHPISNWAMAGRDSMSLNCRDEGLALLHLSTIRVTASLVLFLMVLPETGASF